MTDGTRLHALGGEPPPPELAGDLRSWAMLPRRARDGFWELLQPNLAPEVDERITARVQALMKELELTPAQLAPPVRACARRRDTTSRQSSSRATSTPSSATTPS